MRLTLPACYTLSMTQTCYTCNGTGKAPYDPTMADKVGLIAKHKECYTCEGRGVSGPRPVRQVKINNQPYEPVPDDFWDTWGV